MLVLQLLFAGLLACGAPRPEPQAEAGPAIALAAGLPFAELEIPPDSRPDGREPPVRIPVRGWKLVGTERDAKLYEAPLPIRPRSLFFHRPGPGMAVYDGDREIPHRRSVRTGPRWRHTAETILLAIPSESGPPGDRIDLVYERATERERVLNHRFSGVEHAEDFVRTRAKASATSYAGLLLPAPGVAAWDVVVPPAAELVFRPGLVRPETADGPPSDGATVRVEVEVDGAVTPVWEEHLRDDRFDLVRVDMSAWSGQPVRLRVRSDPGPTATFDYAFLADPVLTPRRADPKRVVVVFVDTVRSDHLALYGYHRDTAPSLDDFARDAMVFDQARSVAPWTLPAARGLFSGRQPELWAHGDNLHGILRAHGWATSLFAGNIYLTANFDMTRDWGTHHAVNWPMARDQVDLALDWLDEQEGRDAYLVLHFMDPHLPHQEPASYRRLFAGDAPEQLARRKYDRNAVIRARLDEQGRQYVRDRYDQNLRYVHDEIARLFRVLDEDDVVVYLSDHGEEFWEHNRFEHGHSLYDELLRVPLVIRAPGVPPGRIAEPVSLLDVAPTVLDLVGIDGGQLDGTSLVPATQGDAEALAMLQERDLAFGRPLYGNERWGVLHDQHKYWFHEGKEALYDLSVDPIEKSNLIAGVEGYPGVEWRSHLANTLGREVLVGYRLNVTLGRTMPTHDFVCELTVPGGVERAWIGVDSLRRSSAEVSVDGEVVRAVWHAGYTGDREIFIIPSDPMEEVTTHLHGLATHGDQTGELIVPEHRDPRPGATRTPLARAQVGNRWVVLTYGIGLVPPDVGEAVDGYDAEVRGALEALGYLGGKDAPPPAGTEGSDEVPPAEGTDEVPPADSDSDEHPASGASSGPE